MVIIINRKRINKIINVIKIRNITIRIIRKNKK